MPPPLKLAIVGGGPSAFYVASRLLQLLPRSQTQPNALGNALRVHMYDRLWTPHGLVRYGVAPDHPEVKNCTNKFDEVATQDPRFSFFGNTSIGHQNSQLKHDVLSKGKKSYLNHTLPLELTQILQNYTHLLIATGSPLSKLHPSLFPPADSLDPNSSITRSRVLPALSLVHWYTQHPSNPPPPPLESTRHVTIIGMGNVALDVARMLLSSVERLEKGEPPELDTTAKRNNNDASRDGGVAQSSIGYDLPSLVLSLLRRSAVGYVSILGRRGPLEAAFTARELREMIGLESVKMNAIPPETLQEARKGGKVSRQQGRILQLLEKVNDSAGKTDTPTKRSWSLEFYRSPLRVRPAPPDATHGMKLELEVAHTRLEVVESKSGEGVKVVAVPTGETSIVPTDMVVTSMGFEREGADVYEQLVEIVRKQAQGLTDALSSEEMNKNATHSSTGSIPTDSQGRVLLPPSLPVSTADNTSVASQAEPVLLKNVYASGWASMGARGVLAATMADAYGVAETIVRDYTAGIENKDMKDVARSNESGRLNQNEIQVTNTAPDPTLPPHEVMEAIPDLEEWKARDALVTIPPTPSTDEAVEVLSINQKVDAQESSSGKYEVLGQKRPFVVTYQDWKRIDNEEIRRGAELGKERERMNWEEVVEFLQNRT